MNLLIENIGHLVTMNPAREILTNAWVFIQDGRFHSLGSGPAPDTTDAERLNAKGGILLPGFINTHHHMKQSLMRAYTPIANESLYGWLRGLSPRWAKLTPDDLYISAQVAMVELMLSGCTTTVDHHYAFTGGSLNWIDQLFAAADVMGMRMCAARGAMDVVSDIYADWQTQKVEAVLADLDRLATRYHDPSPGSFRQLACAPTSVLSVSPEFYREVGALAERRGLLLHTHCGETREEIERALAKRGRRPLEILEDAGWLRPGTWLAHAIHYTTEEVIRLGQLGVGISHCPHANMRLGSGTCRVREQRAAGVKISVGVDGSASNDSGHFLAELQQALYVSRLSYGADSLTAFDVLEFGTLGGAEVLHRLHDLGSIEPGKCADAALFPSEDWASLGAENPVLGLVFCRPRDVDALVIHGQVRVRDGTILGLDLARLAEQHRASARKLWSD